MYSNVSLCTLKLQFLLIYFFYINNHSGQWWVVIKSFPIVGKGIILCFLNDLCWKNNESLVNWCKHWIKTVNINLYRLHLISLINVFMESLDVERDKEGSSNPERKRVTKTAQSLPDVWRLPGGNPGAQCFRIIHLNKRKYN